MQIESQRIILRPWKETDVDELATLANNRKIADNLRDGFPFPYELENARDFVQMAINAKRDLLFAVETEGRLAGGCGIMFKTDVYRKNVEIGYWLGEPFWGKGYATEMICGLRDYIFSKLDIVRIYAEPYADNIGSRRALEKAGFNCEAVFKNNVFKNNVLKDSCIYSILQEK
ncbi:MAG: GNAT family N-acetyltransferase [Bacteroidales bacterium]|nr:GNAT family N-acetyltransferase [Bacteroidales bacterium]